jgi:uncharacterized protein
MPMSHKDLWVKIKRETKGKAPAEELGILRGYLADWPEYKGPYQELGKKLATRAERLERVLSVRSSHEAHTDPFSVRKRGLAEVALIGLPNCGKSTLFSSLTGAPAETADYPYTTLVPNVGMLAPGAFEFEIVDLPPLPEEPLDTVTYAAGLREAAANAGILAVVVDLTCEIGPALEMIGARLTELGVSARAEAAKAAIGMGERERRAVVFGTRHDLSGDTFLENLRRFAGEVFTHPFTEGGRRAVGVALAAAVDRMVVTARDPRSPSDPVDYALPRGATVRDLAAAIHGDLARKARVGRVGGPSAKHDGQEVGLDHPLVGGDLVEIVER